MAENDPAAVGAQSGAPAQPAAPSESAAAPPTQAAPPAVAVEPVAPAAPVSVPAEPAADGSAPAAPAEAAKPAEAEAALTPEPSLLELVTAKPAEEKPPEAAKPAEAPAAPAYEFKFPEGVKVDPERVSAYTALLTEAGISPENGQKLVDFHAATMQQFANDTRKEQWKTFSETRKGWRDEIMADEEIGGAGFETTKVKIAQMRELLWKPEEAKALNDFLATTGAGDHPIFWKGLARIADRLREPAAPPAAQKPAPDSGKPPASERRKIIYDNPRSRSSA